MGLGPKARFQGMYHRWNPSLGSRLRSQSWIPGLGPRLGHKVGFQRLAPKGGSQGWVSGTNIHADGMNYWKAHKITKFKAHELWHIFIHKYNIYRKYKTGNLMDLKNSTKCASYATEMIFRTAFHLLFIECYCFIIFERKVLRTIKRSRKVS